MWLIKAATANSTTLVTLILLQISPVKKSWPNLMRQRLSFANLRRLQIVSIILWSDAISSYPFCSPGYYFTLKPIYTPERNTVTPAQMSQEGDYKTGYYSDSFTVKYDADKLKFLVVPLILALNVTIFSCFYKFVCFF